MFLFKKLVSAFLMPMPFGLGILLCGLWCLWRGRIKAGTILASVAFGFLLLVSIAPLTSGPLGRLEAEVAAPQTFPQVDYVVVLGSWHSAKETLPLLERLGPDARARLLHGLSLLRQQPQARLIFSGHAGLGRQGKPSHAEVMRDAALQLGVPEEMILIEPLPQDTFNEARLISARVGQAPFLLVTDASHMPRALALFEAQGSQPVPAPTNYRALSKANTLLSWFPKSHGLNQTERYWHEMLGRIWARWRGQMD